MAQLPVELWQHLHLDACLTQQLQAMTSHEGIGVEQSYHDAADAMGDDGIGAGGLLAVVAAGLQRHIHRGTGAVDASGVGGAEGVAFGVQVAVAMVIAARQHLAIAHNERTNEGIGIDPTLALLRLGHRFAHQRNLGFCYHIGRKFSDFFPNFQIIYISFAQKVRNSRRVSAPLTIF